MTTSYFQPLATFALSYHLPRDIPYPRHTVNYRNFPDVIQAKRAVQGFVVLFASCVGVI
jgi:hypothetical protein